MRGQRSRLSFVGLGAVLWVLAAAAGAWGAAAEAGKAWLLSTVEADGAWRSERDPAGLRSTAAALSALGAEGGEAVELGRLWLAGRQARSLEEAEAAMGQVIGLAGNTGFSPGPHLHFAVERNEGMRVVSVPFTFDDCAGTGVVPQEDAMLSNCNPEDRSRRAGANGGQRLSLGLDDPLVRFGRYGRGELQAPLRGTGTVPSVPPPGVPPRRERPPPTDWAEEAFGWAKLGRDCPMSPAPCASKTLSPHVQTRTFGVRSPRVMVRGKRQTCG